MYTYVCMHCYSIALSLSLSPCRSFHLSLSRWLVCSLSLAISPFSPVYPLALCLMFLLLCFSLGVIHVLFGRSLEDLRTKKTKLGSLTRPGPTSTKIAGLIVKHQYIEFEVWLRKGASFHTPFNFSVIQVPSKKDLG